MDLKNKKKAAAIKYTKEELKTPVVAALGSGEAAKKIIEQAKKNGIEIVENKDFFQYEALFKQGGEIPVEVYNIVVDILVNIIDTNKGGIINAQKNFS